jgi:hypothetical protein
LASATQGVSNVIFLYEGLILLIKFFASTVPVILLPIAFILRLLPPTRKTGNTIIALSLAAIVVLPLSVIIVGEMNKAIERPKVTVENMDKLNSKAWAMLTAGIFCQFKPMRAMWGMNEYAFAALVCLPLLAIFPLGPSLFAACFSTISQLVYPLVTEIIKLVQLVLLLQWLSWAEVAVGQYGGFDPAGKGWPAQSFPVLMDFLANVNNAVLVGYINTLVITIITISGARSISTALGGDWYLAGVERLI